MESANKLNSNIEIVEAKIRQACATSGRNRSDVTLIAVSKLHPSQRIVEAHQLGLKHFGENYAQELRDKVTELSSLNDIIWHAIGPVQVKNAKYIARAAHYFHALESIEVAQELSKRRSGNSKPLVGEASPSPAVASRHSGYPLSGDTPQRPVFVETLKCFIEVNVAKENSKAGIEIDSVEPFLNQVKMLPNLEIIGLSAMPPLTENEEDNRVHFRTLAQLANQLNLKQLSMGTTGDYAVAIEEGATFVRVGTAIFGARRK
jgi:PLP dependent protein